MKTGRDQGVLLDYPHSIDIVTRRLEAIKMGRKRNPKKPRPKGGEKLFPISPAVYRKWWEWAAKRNGVKQPPHTCRHTAASHDLYTGYRTQAQILRRGRWQADKSVQRYAQTHKWAVAVAQQSTEVMMKGQAILAKRLPRPTVARE